MKKFIFASLFAVLVLPLTVSAQMGQPMMGSTIPGMPGCVMFSRNVGFGNRHADIVRLQDLLRSRGLLNSESTGYFGRLTLQAVKDFQRSQGVPPTGFVGILTRAKLNGMVCLVPPVPPTATTTSIQVTNPKGGETWGIYTTQKITWTDSNVYIQAPKYDIKVQLDLDCQPNQPCILLYPIPATIAVGVSSNEFNWIVGNRAQSSLPNAGAIPPLAPGKYRVFVCHASTTRTQEDLNSCAKSASYIMIVNAAMPAQATSTPTLTHSSRTTALVGQQITLTGTNFTTTGNSINFGTGAIANVASTNNGTTLSFTIPSNINAACYYQTPACLMPSISITPGNYKISVTNANGTSNQVNLYVSDE